MNCTHWEAYLSDYLEGGLGTADRTAMDLHLESCDACRGLLAGIQEVVGWGEAFADHPAPAWLAGRIVLSTPPVVRERWRDTLAGAWRMAIEPRIAMTVFASVLVLGWTANLAGADIPNLVRNPSSVYYGAQNLAYGAYDEAVRTWYGSRIVTEIHCRIEQLWEAS
jgi:anti-sigma factor RsiW